MKDQIDIILELIPAFVSAKEMPLTEMFNLQFMRDLHSIIKFLPDGRDVHGDADDFLVSRELFGVDRGQERPGVLVAAKLREDGLTDGDVLLNLGASRPFLLPHLHLLRAVNLLLRGGGVLEAGVGCRLSLLLLLGGREDLARPFELLLGRLSITAGTAPLPSRSLIERLQLINGRPG